MREIWALVNEMSPYLLLGFAFAGLLHSFVPASLYGVILAKTASAASFGRRFSVCRFPFALAA